MARVRDDRPLDAQLDDPSLTIEREEAAVGRREPRRSAEDLDMPLHRRDQQLRIIVRCDDGDVRDDPPSASCTFTSAPNSVGRCSLPRLMMRAYGSKML